MNYNSKTLITYNTSNVNKLKSPLFCGWVAVVNGVTADTIDALDVSKVHGVA